MHELNPTSTLAFLRRFRLKGGVIRRFILRNTAADSVSVKLLLTVTDTTTQEKVKLSLVIREVDEYRFQKRPGTNVFAIREVRIGKFDGEMGPLRSRDVDDLPLGDRARAGFAGQLDSGFVELGPVGVV